MMELSLLFSVLMALALGCGLLRLTFRRPIASHPAWSMAMAWGLGQGMLGTLYHLALRQPMLHHHWLVGETLLVALVWLAVWRNRVGYKTDSATVLPGQAAELTRLPAWLWVFPAMALLLSLSAAALITLKTPHGQIDALTIWNLHAKFLLAGVAYWQLPEVAALPWWFHYDYPLLLSSMVARTWHWMGNASLSTGPLALNGAFVAAIVLMLFGSLWRLQGRFQAWFALTAVLASSFLFRTAALQVADAPLAFYLLAAVTLVAFAERASTGKDHASSRTALVLAGFMLGCAAWIKNEGILHALLLGLSVGLVSLITRNGPGWFVRLAWMMAGLLPMALLLVGFKAEVRVANDLLMQSPANLWQHLRTVERYGLVASQLLQALLTAGGLLVNPVTLLFFAVLLGWRNPDQSLTHRVVLWYLALFLLALFGVYLLSPHDPAWHVQTSALRLLLQVWPVYIFAVAAGIPTPTQFQPQHETSLQAGAV